MMPVETQDAVTWALQQKVVDIVGNEIQITKEMYQELVDKVCEYFNEHNIVYGTFSYDDLKPFLS